MENLTCISCQKTKPTLTCECCHEPLCKKCAQFLDEAEFSYLLQKPKELSYTTYCRFCYDAHIAPELVSYNELVEQAKNIMVFNSSQGKETRLIKRDIAPIEITDCLSEEETVLRLAFQAAKLNLNAIIDVHVTSEKVHIGTYRTLKWRGIGVPAHVELKKINK